MAGAMLPKGRTKVLTSARAKESGSVDTSLQVNAEELQEIEEGRKKKEALLEHLENSAEGRPHVTSRILLNKWQRLKEVERQKKIADEMEYRRRMDDERYEQEQAELHWNCPFLRHC
jgi:hypothetical protein